MHYFSPLHFPVPQIPVRFAPSFADPTFSVPRTARVQQNNDWHSTLAGR